MSQDEDSNEAFVARTLSKAGARRDAPAALRSEIQAGVERAWRQAVQRRRTRRRLQLVGAAAVLLVGVIAVRHWPQHPANASAGIFVASRGQAEIDSPGQGVMATGGHMLSDDTRIRTGPDGRVLLAIANLSVRVGGNSSLHLLNAADAELEHGQIYLDSNAVENADIVPFAVATRFGRIRHVGTQYQLAVSDEGLVLSVREGRVRIESASVTRELTPRERLTVARNGTATVDSISTFGDDWSWAAELRPDFPIEGRSLAEFFAWFTRESGIVIRYADEHTHRLAQQTSMSGSIAGLPPLQALQGVLTATRFEYRTQADGSFLIEIRQISRDKLPRDGAAPTVASFAAH